MNLITVAVDFGPATDGLIRFSASLSLDLGATIELIHVHEGRPEDAPAETHLAEEQERLRKLQDVAQRIRKVSSAWVTTKYMIAYGDVAPTILETISNRTDLLLIGRHEPRGATRSPLGKIGEALIRDAKCPVLVLPEDAKFLVPSQLALAVDERPLPPAAAKTVCELVEHFQASLEIFNRATAERTHPAADLDVKFENMSYTYHHFIEEGDLTEFLLRATENGNAAWLVMLHRHRVGWQQWFASSATEKVVERASVPVLVLPRLVETSGDESLLGRVLETMT